MADGQVLSADTILNILDYNPDTGIFTWKKRPLSTFRNRKGMAIWNAKYPGRIAGCVDHKGYLKIKINNTGYAAHRLAYFLMNGVWGECIDHIDGDPTNNAISNLRSVSRAINQRNQKRHSTNSSGFTGVSQNKFGKWVASIRVANKQMYLGQFWVFEDAVKARKCANEKYGFSGRD